MSGKGGGRGSVLGYVVGKSTPTSVTALTSRALAVGEYATIGMAEGVVLGLVERSSIASMAFADIQNFADAGDAVGVAEMNSRDKTYTAHMGVLGFLKDLRRGHVMVPSVPPVPGTAVGRPDVEDLESVFSSGGRGWARIGRLLHNDDVAAAINLDSIVSRHLGILAMTGMGKSNLVSLLAKRIGEVGGTVVIFDYHNDYTSLALPGVNVVDAKINPRLLDADQLSDVLEVRDGANVQQRVVRMAFNKGVREAGDFWKKLGEEIEYIINTDDKKVKEVRSSAYRVQDIVAEAPGRFGDILDPGVGDPMSRIREGMTNVVDISELSEKQANVAVAFYLQHMLRDRKDATVQARGGSGRGRSYMFESPVFVVIEEAHVFIPKDHDTGAKYWAAKIAREGRKFGLGLGVVSQRPRGVDLNVLSQMGSFAIMKIIQEDDQRQIAAAVESASRELVAQLGSLNVGDAVLVGQWTRLPSLVHVDEVAEKVAGADQSAVGAWEGARKMSGAAAEPSEKLVRKDLLMDP